MKNSYKRSYPVELLIPNQDEYGVHRQSLHKFEGFILIKKCREYVDYVMENLEGFTKATQKEINRIKSKRPDVSMALASFKSNDEQTYADVGFIKFRKSIYLYHVYDFIDKPYFKVEVTAISNVKKRSKKSETAVRNELFTILKRIASRAVLVSIWNHK
ncbi:MAG: hypothetical protein NTZ80_04425 [Patescibacteria group bacterium]|nr:hypothetical protein [Patescibacteria group bacterium]